MLIFIRENTELEWAGAQRLVAEVWSLSPWKDPGIHLEHRMCVDITEQSAVLSLLQNPTSSHQPGSKQDDLRIKPVNFGIKQTHVQSLLFFFKFNLTVLWLPADSVTSLYFCLLMCKMGIKITTMLGSYED